MKRSDYSKAVRARDEGLRRIRKITWRVGLLSVALAAVIGAKFAHLSAMLPHLSVGSPASSSPSPGTSTGATPAGSTAGTSTPGSSSPSGISPSSGVSTPSNSPGGGGVTTSGGS